MKKAYLTAARSLGMGPPDTGKSFSVFFCIIAQNCPYGQGAGVKRTNQSQYVQNMAELTEN
jgi:hypothetical protein